MSTAGAIEECEARVVGVTEIHYNRETGEGVSPSPSSPTPMAIATTVHDMRDMPEKKVWRHPHQGKDEDQSRVATEFTFT